MHPHRSRASYTGNVKWFLQTGLALLCLFALVLSPVVCAHTFHQTSTGCAQGMTHSMPREGDGHALPPCCAKHPADQPANTATPVTLIQPAATPVALNLPSIIFEFPSTPRQVSQATPSGAFSPPLRI